MNQPTPTPPEITFNERRRAIEVRAFAAKTVTAAIGLAKHAALDALSSNAVRRTSRAELLLNFEASDLALGGLNAFGRVCEGKNGRITQLSGQLAEARRRFVTAVACELGVPLPMKPEDIVMYEQSAPEPDEAGLSVVDLHPFSSSKP